MRINKYLALCGVCSRRTADKYIEEKRVTVNGHFPGAGDDVDEKDLVCVDGKEVRPVSEHTVLAYYKPVGVVCTERDEHAKKTVIDDLGYHKRVTYAGRLDKDSEGLLLMTDDGDLIQAMMKGANAHEKEYEVTVDKDITASFTEELSKGIYLEELDRTTRPCKIRKTGKRSFNIILTQGLNRQIRRMCSAKGYNVVTLKRIRVMTVKLDYFDLKPAEYKELNKAQKDELYKACGLK